MSRTTLALLIASVLALTGVAACLLSHPSYTPYAKLEMPPSKPQEGALRARFLGVSTILLDDGKHAILVDGFFSRPPRWRTLLGHIAPDRKSIAFAMEAGQVPELEAVLVAHSHYDHALDSAIVAMRSDKSLLIGSESTANIARGAKFPEARFRSIHGGERFPLDGFTVRTFRSIHSPHALFGGTIDAPLTPPARVWRYREGGVYSFLIERPEGAILVHPGANFIPGMYRGVHADVVFLSIGSLGKQDRTFIQQYWREVVRATHAKLVIPIHWDDFTDAIDQPLRPMPLFADNFDRSMALLRAAAIKDGVGLRLMPFAEPVDIFDRATWQPPQAVGAVPHWRDLVTFNTPRRPW